MRQHTVRLDWQWIMWMFDVLEMDLWCIDKVESPNLVISFVVRCIWSLTCGTTFLASFHFLRVSLNYLLFFIISFESKEEIN